MKKAATVITLTVSSLLLTGCDVPGSIEEFVGWRDKFFLHIDYGAIDELLGPILGLLVVLALGISLYGIIYNLKNRRSILSGPFLAGASMILTIEFLSVYIPISTMIGEAILPSGLTLDKVFEALHWELTLDLSRILTAGWGITFTLVIPLISSFWQIVMMVFALAAMVISITSHSLKGVVFVFAQLFGWAIFLVGYNILVTLIGDHYPSWSFPAVNAFVSGFYTFAVIMGMLICYIAVPWLAASLASSYGNEVIRLGEKDEKEPRERLTAREKLEEFSRFPLPIPFPNGDGGDEEEDSEGDNLPKTPRTPPPQDFPDTDEEKVPGDSNEQQTAGQKSDSGDSPSSEDSVAKTHPIRKNFRSSGEKNEGSNIGVGNDSEHPSNQQDGIDKLPRSKRREAPPKRRRSDISEPSKKVTDKSELGKTPEEAQTLNRDSRTRSTKASSDRIFSDGKTSIESSNKFRTEDRPEKEDKLPSVERRINPPEKRRLEKHDLPPSKARSQKTNLERSSVVSETESERALKAKNNENKLPVRTKRGGVN